MIAMRLHHLAVVVADIRRSAEAYGRLLGLEPTTGVIHDRKQKVHIQFLSGAALGDCELELLVPDSEDSPVAQAQDYLRQQILATSEKMQIDVIDVASSLRERSQTQSGRWFYPHEGHLTAEGHRIVADILAEHFR